MSSPVPYQDPTIFQLRQKIEALHSLIDISAIINSTLDLNELLELAMQLAKKVMRCEAASLMLFNDKKTELIFKIALGEVGTKLVKEVAIPASQGIAGMVAQSGKGIIILDAQNDPRLFRNTDQKTGFITKSLMCAPLITRGEIIGVTQVLNRLTQDPFDEEDLSLFCTFSNQVATAIENTRLHHSLMEKQKIEQELETAAVIQKGFFPQEFPKSKKFEVAVRHLSAKQCSGDFYDIVEYDNNQIGLIIGDVSGKGVPAALHMAGFISDFRSLAPVKRRTEQLFTTLNGMLFKKIRHGRFITTTYVNLDLDTFIVEVVNAGHIPTLRFSRVSGEVSEIWIHGGPPLGILGTLDYTFQTDRLQSGDTILMLTDGLSEALSRDGEWYGYQRIAEVLTRYGREAMETLADRLIESVQEFTTGTDQKDDLTLIVFNLKDL